MFYHYIFILLSVQTLKYQPTLHIYLLVDKMTSDILSHIEDHNLCSIIIGLDANQSKKSTPRRTNIFQSFLKDFSLVTILPDDLPTFHHNNQISESQIDHILRFIPVQSKLSLKFNTHLCQKNNSDNLSSHDVNIGTICFPRKYLGRNPKNI